METLEWTPKLSTGIAEIDVQHRELFARVNGLMEATVRGSGKEEIRPMLEFLAGYAVEHFRADVIHMRRLRYPCVDVHEAQHDRFVKDLAFWTGRYEAHGADSLLLIDLLQWISSWVMEHTSGVDVAMGDFFRGKRARLQ